MLALRPASDTDGAGVAALVAAVFAEYEGCPFVAAEFPELKAPARHYGGRGGGIWVLVDAADRIVGSIALSAVDGGPVFELNKVYLDRAHRGKGLGGRLYRHARAEAEARGATALQLWTDTRFLDAHGFYERLGFRRLPVLRYLADATHGWEYAYRLDLAP